MGIETVTHVEKFIRKRRFSRPCDDEDEFSFDPTMDTTPVSAYVLEVVMNVPADQLLQQLNNAFGCVGKQIGKKSKATYTWTFYTPAAAWQAVMKLQNEPLLGKFSLKTPNN